MLFFYPLTVDKISLFTQKLCFCCVASPDIDLDNVEPEKMEWCSDEEPGGKFCLNRGWLDTQMKEAELHTTRDDIKKKVNKHEGIWREEPHKLPAFLLHLSVGEAAAGCFTQKQFTAFWLIV